MNQSSDASPPRLPGKSLSRLPLVVLLIGLLLTPLLVLSGWYLNVRTSNNAAVRKLEQEARQRGEPITLAELATNYPALPDTENAAVAFIKIWSEDEPEFWAAFAAGAPDLPEGRVEKLDPALPYLGSDARKISRDRALNPESLQAADLFLAENASRLAAVRAALTNTGFHFDINFEAGPAALLPHLSRLKREAMRFQIEALVAAEKGDVVGATQALTNIARTSQLLAREPTLISQLVRVATLSMVLESMEQLLSRQRLTTDQLNQLRNLLDRSTLEGAARSALIYERPFSLATFDPQVVAQTVSSLAPGDSAEEPADAASKVRQGFKVMQAVGYLALDRRLMLETFQQAIVLAGKETPEALKQYEALFDETDAKARKFPPKILSGMMLPALRKVPERFASYEARRRAALTAIAIQRFRLEHNDRLPESLAALVPQFLPSVPTDPFDGAPLRFKRLDDGFIIYSVGRDREDNSGKEYIRGNREHTDVTFIVQR